MKGSLDKTDRVDIFRIVAIYAFFSALWIYLSDEAMAILIHDPVITVRMSILKGLLFIALTSYLLTHLIASDVRRYRRTERNLRESERKFRAIFDQTFQFIGLLSLDGMLLEVNRTALAFGGIEESEVIGKPFWETVWWTHSPEEQEKLKSAIAKAREGEFVRFETTHPAAGGAFLHIDFSLKPVRDDEGKVILLIPEGRDITERKIAEQALQKLNEELEKRVRTRTSELEESRAQLKAQYEELHKTYDLLTKVSAERIQAMEELREMDRMMIQQSRMAAMGEMLGNIAHQWRQPLNILGIVIQDLGLSYECGKLTKELLDARIDKAMNVVLHLSQTIDDFISFTAVDKEKTLFSANQLVAKTISLVEESFRNQHIAIDISVSEDPQINGYPNEYTQVLLNILMNARDAFLERGIKNARITVRSWEENGRAVVTVTDNAGGIKEGILGKIFDAYFTTKELGKGTGVGLFMSKTIIEKNMGGRLSARNTDGGVELRIEV